MNKDDLVNSEDGEGASNMASCLHIICVVAGIGVLGIPYAFKQGGWISVLFIFLSSLMSIYTGKILIKCLYYRENEERLDSYSEVGYHAFGRIGQLITQFFFYTLILTVVCLFFMFSVDAFKQFANNYNILSSLTIETYGVLSGIIVLIPLLSMKTIKKANVLSFFGVFMTVISSIICVVYGFVQLSKNQIKRGNNESTSLINFSTLALSFATIGVSYGGSPLYPSIEKNMKHKRDWSKVLTTSIALISVLYLFVGICCYYLYEDATINPVTNNLRDVVLKVWINLIMTAHLLLTAPIVLCVFCRGIEDSLNNRTGSQTTNKLAILRICLRTVTVSVLALVAIKFQYFEILMGLMGSFSNCAITYVLPVLCYLKLTGARNKKTSELVFLLFIVLLGTLTSILGVYQSIEEIRKK